MKENKWMRLLAYVTGLVNQDLLLQNEYLAAENRILRGHLPARLCLSDPERSTLAEIGKRLGRKALRCRCVEQTLRPVNSIGRQVRLWGSGEGKPLQVAARRPPWSGCHQLLAQFPVALSRCEFLLS